MSGFLVAAERGVVARDRRNAAVGVGLPLERTRPKPWYADLRSKFCADIITWLTTNLRLWSFNIFLWFCSVISTTIPSYTQEEPYAGVDGDVDIDVHADAAAGEEKIKRYRTNTVQVPQRNALQRRVFERSDELLYSSRRTILKIRAHNNNSWIQWTITVPFVPWRTLYIVHTMYVVIRDW